MPLYEYACSCGTSFEARAGYDDRWLACLDCGAMAERASVYRDQGVIFAGGGFTKSVLPPPGPEAQQEFNKELRKRGWDGDRAVSEIRKNTTEDKQGRKQLNGAAMTKTA